MKKALLFVALFTLGIGVVSIDSDSVKPVIFIASGGGYLFLSLIANWNDLMKRIEKGNM